MAEPDHLSSVRGRLGSMIRDEARSGMALDELEALTIQGAEEGPEARRRK